MLDKVGVLTWPGYRTTALESIPGLILLGIGAGFNEAAVNPTLAAICSDGYPYSEGSVFALADMCFAVGFASGPLITAALYAGGQSIQ
jgi:MFS family permease